MRILTFNWHEAYLCTLAKTGHELDIVERLKGGRRAWFFETRPIPSKARIVKEASARRGLRERGYDAVVCHNLQDLHWIREWPVPKVLVFHNRLTTEIALGGHTVDLEAYRAEVRRLVDTTPDLRLVFISESKRADWRLEGEVILPGIDLADYCGFEGHEPRVLRVGNFMRRRDLMLGYTAQRRILKDLPSTLLGLNDAELDGRFTTSWDDLKQCYRSHRVFLNTTVEGYEDGYNLAMLEAMATGMPIVTTANSSSPVRDGIEGFVSESLETLSERLECLLADRALATDLGARARARVADCFPMEAFVARWNRVLRRPNARGAEDPIRARAVDVTEIRPEGGGERAARGRPSSTPPRGRPLRILLAYVAYPATTARYLETSLRRVHEVVTVGPALGPELREAWNLGNLREPVRPHDIPCPANVDLDRVVHALPSGWHPDLLLWVESIPGYLPTNLHRVDCPTACYMIDSHLSLDWHLQWATRFDWVFVAQRAYGPAFVEAGCPRVRWLPLAADPAIHGKARVPKRFDVGFVGSLTSLHGHRSRLLDLLSARFDVHVERSFLRDMARTLSASRIVFNHAVRDDLNMRVFEALASGSMLLTDRAPGSGLAELFADREDLVLYDDTTLESLASHYLAHEAEREAIAASGRARVLAHHTYDHRAAELLATVFGWPFKSVLPHLDFDRVLDPLVVEGLELVAQGRHRQALTRLELASQRRELSARERAALTQATGECLGSLGQPGVSPRHDAERTA